MKSILSAFGVLTSRASVQQSEAPQAPVATEDTVQRAPAYPK
jgi:hypothetical protein